MKIFQHQKGFTLIELLVVISIIGLLSSVVIAALNNARGKGTVAAGKTFDGHTYQAFGAEAVGIWNFDEGSLPAKDTSGYGNDFTAITNAGFAWTGSAGALRGNAAVNTGGTSYFTTGVGSMFKAGNWDGKSGSVSFWINPTNIARGWIIYMPNLFVASRNSGLTNNFELQYGSAFTSVSSTDTTDFSLYLNKWTHVVIAWSTPKATVNFYINGKLEGSQPITGTFIPPTGEMRVGAAASSFLGSLDEIRIYTQAIQTAEVQKLYAEGLKTRTLAEAK